MEKTRSISYIHVTWMETLHSKITDGASRILPQAHNNGL